MNHAFTHVVVNKPSSRLSHISTCHAVAGEECLHCRSAMTVAAQNHASGGETSCQGGHYAMHVAFSSPSNFHLELCHEAIFLAAMPQWSLISTDLPLSYSKPYHRSEGILIAANTCMQTFCARTWVDLLGFSNTIKRLLAFNACPLLWICTSIALTPHKWLVGALEMLTDSCLGRRHKYHRPASLSKKWNIATLVGTLPWRVEATERAVVRAYDVDFYSKEHKAEPEGADH